MSTKEHPSRVITLDLSGSVAPVPMPVGAMPPQIWLQPEALRSAFHAQAPQFFQCESVLAVTGIESGISALARLFQTWYGSMRVVLAEPCFEQWDLRLRRASHVVLDWPADFILEGDIPECDVVVLGRPVNPSGQLITIDKAKQLAQRLRAQGGWLILDEAYLDWTQQTSYCAHLDDVPAIVLRAMAPFSGLSGANIAFVCATRTVNHALLEEVGTQAVSASQWWLALEYFKSEAWRNQQFLQLQPMVERLQQLWQRQLDRFDLASQCVNGGYFVSFTHADCAPWTRQLEQMGILVRLYASESDWIRCSVPCNSEGWVRLERALAQLV